MPYHAMDAVNAKPRILVVDDARELAREMVQQLEQMGYASLGYCTQADAAIERARATLPDLVLMDIHLGGTEGGITAARTIRASQLVPIVFLTAVRADEALPHGRLPEPFAHILKPFSTRELHTVIEMALYRSAADARLRKSEQQFRTIFEAEPECVQVFDADACLLQVNPAGLRLFEAESIAQLRAHPLHSLVEPTHLAAFTALHRRVLAGASGTLEFEVIGLKGTRRWVDVHAAPMHDGQGDITMMLSVARDITERRRAFQQRRVSDKVLSAVSQGVVIAGADLRVIEVNNAFLQTTGYDRHEIIGNTCKMLQGPLSDAATRKRITEALAAGRGFQGEILNYRKDGNTFWNELTISPVLNDHGRVGQFVGIMRDVTERKQAQSAQQDYLEQLQGLSRRVLAAQETERRRVAHELHDELGQYLTAIKINLQTHTAGGEASTQSRREDNIRIVDEAIQQVRRLASALRPSVLDDLGLEPALKWMAEQNAGRSQIAIHCRSELAGARLLPEVETACFRIAQEALTNIIRHAACLRVDIHLFVRMDSLFMTVQDDGQGFDVNAALERARRGGSLGVLGMQERASLIGGSLTLSSTPGDGSSLTLECPLHLALDAN